MANLPSSHYAADCAIVERSLRAIDATKEIIRDYTLQASSLAQNEPGPDQWHKGSDFQRQKIKEILDAALVFQEVMEKVVESLSAPSSPVRRLPAEILLEVFSHAVKQEVENRRNQMERWKSMSFRCVPIILARVCSQWRALVRQNPALWEQILIPALSITWLKQEIVARHVAKWMVAKGVQQKLSLFINGWNDREMERVISYVGSHATPWRSIDVVISYASPMGRWDAQSMYATRVKLYRRKHESSLSFFLPLLRKARELTITGTPPVWGNAPWTSLVSLKIQLFATKKGEPVESLSFEASELRGLLNAAPCLTELQLDFARASEVPPTPSTHLSNPVEHQRIESLSLHLHHLSNNMGLCGLQTTMPLLRSLSILSLGPGPLALGETGETFVGRWDQPKSLSVRGLETSGLSRALALFAHLPNVDTVDLSGLQVNALVRLMNGRYRHHTLQAPGLPLPQLTKVVLKGTDIQGGTLIDMIQARLADVRGLEVVQSITDVEIYDSPGVAIEDWKCIQNLLERGRSQI